jgi:hypothetical protein
MNHIDEGTIHAWLDGALDATHSREVELHVAGCATCATAVAEARGLVAASSRILTALDDVPANVTPKRPAVAPKQRVWRAAPWVTGIAAAMMLAIGLQQMDKESPLTSTAPLADGAIRGVQSADTGRLTAGAGTDLTAESKKALQSQEAGAPVVVAAPATSPAARQSSPATSRVAGGVAKVGGAAGSGTAERDAATPQVAAAPPAEQRFDASTARADLSKQAAAPMAAPSVATDETASRRQALSDTRLRVSEVVGTAEREKREADLVAGCYRIDRQERSTLGAVAGTATAQANRARTSRAPAPAAAVAEAPSRPATLQLIKLDTTRHVLGFTARSVTTDSSLGAWRRIGDSVRVDLAGAGVFTFAASSRVSCPE